MLGILAACKNRTDMGPRLSVIGTTDVKDASPNACEAIVVVVKYLNLPLLNPSFITIHEIILIHFSALHLVQFIRRSYMTTVVILTG